MDVKNLKNLEKIDNYLSGNYSIEESQEFLASLESDQELSREFSFVKNMKLALSENRSDRLKEQFKSWDAALKENAPDSKNQETKNITLNPWKKYIAIAASVALLIFISWGIVHNNSTDNLALFEANFKTYPAEINRGSQRNAADAFALYANKNFKEAIIQFKKLNDESAAFFLGNSYLAINEPQKAIAALTNYSGQMYSSEKQWYLALAYLQNDNIFAAKLILEKLQLKKGAYGKKASSLLLAI